MCLRVPRDQTGRGRAGAVAGGILLGSFNKRGMSGQPQIIVAGEIDCASSVD